MSDPGPLLQNSMVSETHFFCFTFNNWTEQDLEIIKSWIQRECSWAIIGQESGPMNGVRHLQGAFLTRSPKRKLNLQRVKAWYPTAKHYAWIGTPGRRKPPSYWLDYCTKQDSRAWVYGSVPEEFQYLEDNALAAASPPSTRRNSFREALSLGSAREAIEYLWESEPATMARFGETISRNVSARFGSQHTHQYTSHEFRLALEKDFSKSILIWGNSGVGKTQFAFAHFNNPLLVSHLDDLKKIRSCHDGLVFDDMAFHNLPIETVIKLVDVEMERSIHCRHSCGVIPAKLPRIFTHNTQNPFYENETHDSEQEQAVERRVRRLFIADKLF